MDITEDWSKIKRQFNTGFGPNLHIAIASVDAENNPTVTPIAFLFLNDNQTGFYFEKYPSKLLAHAKTNKNVCHLAVNSNRLFWLKSLFKGKFNNYPAIKLHRELGPKREANENELNRLKRRMSATKRLKRHKYPWSNMECIREISFTKAEKIQLGNMTKNL